MGERLEFVAPPFAGHLNPLAALARGAAGAGYEVRFLTAEAKCGALREAGLAAVALRSVAPGALEAIAETGERVGSHPWRLWKQFRENLAVLPAIREELIERWRRERPAVVIADSVAPVAGLAAEELGIPWITTIATPFAIEQRRGTPAYCGGWSPEGWPGRDAAGRAVIHGFKSLVGRMCRRELRALGLAGLYRGDGSEAIYSPRAILGFGMSELEFPRDWPAGFRMIGPAPEAPERCAEIAYPVGRPRVLVTLGTHLPWAKRGLAETVRGWGERRRGACFVISWGRPAGAGEGLERLAENVWAAPFVPYARDLGSFAGVMHHGGAGITAAAILAGVPSVVVPQDYDQFDYAARVAWFGAGVRARSVAEAEGMVGRLLREPWPRLAALQAAARRYRPVEEFLTTVRATRGARTAGA